MIILDSKFKILTDRNNYTLHYSEQKTILDKKTGESKIITSVDEWHYPSIQGALRTFLRESLRPSTSIENVLTRINEVENIIKNVRL